MRYLLLQSWVSVICRELSLLLHQYVLVGGCLLLNDLELCLWSRYRRLVELLVEIVLVLHWHLVGVLLSVHPHILLHAILLVPMSLLALILIHVVIISKLVHLMWHPLVLMTVYLVLVLILILMVVIEAALLL